MSFNTSLGRQSFSASASQTAFTFNFKIFNDTDLKVYLTQTGDIPNDNTDILVLSTDYTVVIDGDNGGTITLVSGATSGDTVIAIRELPQDRTVSYVTNGDLIAATLNEDQDYQTYLTLDTATVNNRAISLQDTDILMSKDLPPTKAGYVLQVNSSGTAFEYVDPSTSGASEAAAVSAAEAVVSAGEASTSASEASASATLADTAGQLQTWQAEAESMTSESYANQPEDENVIEYTSDGDGTFTGITTSKYSALHYSLKAGLLPATLNPELTTLKVDGKYMSPYLGRNKFINGAMNIWQRGTSGFTIGGYTADRWYASNTAGTVQRTTSVPDGGGFTYSFYDPSLSNNELNQMIELVETGEAGEYASGQTFTLSYWAQGIANSGHTVNGTFKDSSSSSTNEVVAFTEIDMDNITDTWAKYTTQITISGVAGATNIGLEIKISATNTSSNLLTTGLQLEEGTVATPFEHKSIGEELLACQRYYYNQTRPSYGSAKGSTVHSSLSNIDISYPVTMRDAPTKAYTLEDCTISTIIGAEDGTTLVVTATSSTNTPRAINFTADGEL